MGGFKDYHQEFQHMPDRIVLDFEDIFWKLRAQISRITTMTVDWDAVFQQLFQGVCLLEDQNQNYWVTYSLRDGSLRDIIQDMVYSDSMFEVNNLRFTPGAQHELERALLSASLKMKEQLLFLNAYRFGKFPYSYRTMITDGCLLFSKNESIYDTPVLDC